MYILDRSVEYPRELKWFICDIEYSRLSNDVKVCYIQGHTDTMKERLEFIFALKCDRAQEELRIYICEIGLARHPEKVNPVLLEVLENIYQVGLEGHE